MGWQIVLPVALVAMVLGRRWIAKVGITIRRPAAPKHPDIPTPKRRQAGDPFDLSWVREVVGPAPRRFATELEAYLTIKRRFWLQQRFNDELRRQYSDQFRIRRDGKVVWAAVVQANNLMFKPGNADCPASVLYSEDPWYDTHPAELATLASKMFRLKGTRPREDYAAEIARILTDEKIRGMRLQVPTDASEGRIAFHSSIVLPRKHLPKGFLTSQIFPVWVDTQPTGTLLLVPAAYWPKPLRMASKG